MMKQHYKAPWSKLLIGVSIFLTILCLGIAMFVSQRTAPDISWLSWLIVALVLACALFTIRGYTITPRVIQVHRLLWSTEIPRHGLETALFEPHAMRGSIRTFGNGGFYSFSGLYWNKRLGSYRAYVTDPSRTVVLRYTSGRTIVVSPATPEDFIQNLGLFSPKTH